jgi:hypothetical protein
MQTSSYEVTVNEPGEPELTRAQVWQGLVMKAENALPFVPGMQRCDLLEKGEGWLMREIQFDGRTIRERVTFEPEERVRFEQISGASGWIDNVIEQRPDGSLGLRFEFRVPDEDVELTRSIEPVYRKAVAATLATVRRLVAEGKIS